MIIVIVLLPVIYLALAWFKISGNPFGDTKILSITEFKLHENLFDDYKKSLVDPKHMTGLTVHDKRWADVDRYLISTFYVKREKSFSDGTGAKKDLFQCVSFSFYPFETQGWPGYIGK